MSGARWLAGEPGLWARLERALGGAEAPETRVTVVRERPGRRRLCRVTLDGGEDLFVKRFYARRGGARPSNRIKSALGLTTARREWRALVRLHGAGVAVPKPRALGVLEGGDFVLAMDHLDGCTLDDVLARGDGDRRALVLAVADLAAALHAAGWVHWDLHHGNVLVCECGPVLLDLQAAWPTRAAFARRRDLGELDHSVATSLSLAQRVRLRARALGLARPFRPDARRRLRAVGRASRQRARAHAASRGRRSLRPGRRYARLRMDGWRGLRLRGVQESAMLEALRAREEADRVHTLKRDARSHVVAVGAGGRAVVVKSFVGGGLRAVADLVRGSPARRGWRSGHALRAHRVGAAMPLAYVERRVLGLPIASTLVLAHVRPAVPADRAAEATPGAVVAALTRLALRLHGGGVSHGDLKASHVLLGRQRGRIRTHLVDLEGVRFPGRLGDADRIRELAQLNASLPDTVPAALRRRAFSIYAAILPFDAARGDALRRIVAASLEREHRWTGADCTLAQRVGRDG